VTVRAWALKLGDLKPLDREGRLRLAARCALRVEPWVAPSDHGLWQEQLAFALGGTAGEPLDPAEAGRRQRLLADAGARSCNRLAATDEPLGRCHGYALLPVSELLAACACPSGPALNKHVIDAAKYAASISAVLAHAGRTAVPTASGAPVDVVTPAFWEEVRADVARVATPAPTLDDLRAVGPLLSDDLRRWLGLTG
jgi:hypothetical protein